MALALEDLAFFSHEVKIPGVYRTIPTACTATPKTKPDRAGIKEARRRAAPTGIA